MPPGVFVMEAGAFLIAPQSELNAALVWPTRTACQGPNPDVFTLRRPDSN